MRRRRSIVPWDILLALLLGIALGLVYAWVVAPVEYVDADPSRLRSDFKSHYRSAVAASYAAAGDLARARARLALLADSDSSQALNAQAQQMLAAGEDFSLVQQLAQLGADILSTPPVTAPASSPVQTASSPTRTPAPTSTRPTRTSATPLAVATPTPRPTFTSTATPAAGFVLVEQETVCEEDFGVPLLQIIVMDSRRRQLAGAELIVTWDGGEDHFFTGFKPELGDGFADFEMEEDVVYAVRVGAGGAPVSNVSSPPCTDSEGPGYAGSLLLTFARP